LGCDQRHLRALRMVGRVRVLDLFAGLGGWSSAFRDDGWDVVTLDFNPRFGTTIVADVLDYHALPAVAALGPYDLVLASPPCEGFTVMNIGKNWTRPTDSPPNAPKTDSARLALRIVERTRLMIAELEPAYFIIENPRGKLRRLDVVADLERRTVTYCQLGERRMKPTDLWGGFPPSLDLPRPCRMGDPCHVSAPRGSRTPGSTQGINGGPARAEIPYGLSRLVCDAATRDLVSGAPRVDRPTSQLGLWASTSPEDAA